jgi:hypothetical protein
MNVRADAIARRMNEEFHNVDDKRPTTRGRCPRVGLRAPTRVFK